MAAKFTGLIKELKKFTYASGDKIYSLKVEFAEKDNIGVFNELNEIDRPETGVVVYVMTEAEHEELVKKEKKGK